MTHESAWADLREGWAFMWQSRPIRGVWLLYGVGLLGVGAVFVLVVPYVQRLFGGGALQVGLVDAVQLDRNFQLILKIAAKIFDAACATRDI